MDLHQNARLTLHSREALAQAVLSQQLTWNAAAAAFRVSCKTARKWVRRYQDQGRTGLCDRSSRPHRSPRQIPSEAAEQVLGLRRQRWTGVRIAQTTGLCRATVSRILRRHRLSRARDLEPSLPVRRYEHPHPGDLLHLDTKKLARIAKPGHRLTGDPRDETRGAGWEMLHVAIDDHSRIAFSRLFPDERAASTVAFLRAAVAYYAASASASAASSPTMPPATNSRLFAAACRHLGIRHLRTRPYTPAPTAKPNASSRPRCGNGPTPASIKTPASVRPSSIPGCISTTGIVPMLVWASHLPSAAPASMGTTC